jgi:hypothetical protein
MKRKRLRVDSGGRDWTLARPMPTGRTPSLPDSAPKERHPRILRDPFASDTHSTRPTTDWQTARQRGNPREAASPGDRAGFRQARNPDAAATHGALSIIHDARGLVSITRIRDAQAPFVPIPNLFKISALHAASSRGLLVGP